MVKVPSPWTFRLAWNLNEIPSFLWAHKRSAASVTACVAAILGRIHARHGETEIRPCRASACSAATTTRA